MVGNRTGTRWDAAVVPREMRVERLAMVVLGLHVVEMHVHQRRSHRTRLHEDDKEGGGQPANHEAIVVNDGQRGT